jgi:hypothetical protein
MHWAQAPCRTAERVTLVSTCHSACIHNAAFKAATSTNVVPHWTAGSVSSKALSPVDARALTWLAFARGCLDAQRLAGSAPDAWDSAAFTATAWSLASQPPFAAAWRELGVQVRGRTALLALHRQSMSAGDIRRDASALHRMQVLHCSVPLAELPAAINGAVVGLAVGPQQQQPTYQHTLNSPADAAPQPCLGLGIVRSMDISAGLIHLLTPLSEAELQLVNVLQVRISLCVDV